MLTSQSYEKSPERTPWPSERTANIRERKPMSIIAECGTRRTGNLPKPPRPTGWAGPASTASCAELLPPLDEQMPRVGHQREDAHQRIVALQPATAQ